MKTTKQLGIWMDHSSAHLTQIFKGSFITETIKSKPELLVKTSDLYYKDESHMLNKEQDQLETYYKKLSDAILDYDEVILFGPTEAKNELANILKENHLFEKIKITIKPTDKMSEKQQHTFLKEYFN